MRKRMIIIILCCLALLLAAAAPALEAPLFEVSWDVFSSGGGQVEYRPYVLNGSIAQPLASGSIAHTGDYGSCSGFWCKVLALFKVYMPAIFNPTID